MHANDCRVFGRRSARADLVVLLLVKGLGEGIADVESRVPRSASRSLLETHQHGVVPGSGRGLKVSNLLARGSRGNRWRSRIGAIQYILAACRIHYIAGISAIGTVHEGRGDSRWQAAQEPRDKLAVTEVVESIYR